MFEEGYISKEDLEKNKKLPLDAMKGKKDLKTIESDYFLEEARRTVHKIWRQRFIRWRIIDSHYIKL